MGPKENALFDPDTLMVTSNEICVGSDVVVMGLKTSVEPKSRVLCVKSPGHVRQRALLSQDMRVRFIVTHGALGGARNHSPDHDLCKWTTANEQMSACTCS